MLSSCDITINGNMQAPPHVRDCSGAGTMHMLAFNALFTLDDFVGDKIGSTCH